MEYQCKLAVCRGSILFHTLTGEIGEVQTTNLGNLPRALIPVKVNTYGTVKPYRIDWRAQDVIHLKGTISDAWAQLTKMRDNGLIVCDDPRLGLPYAVREMAYESAAD